MTDGSAREESNQKKVAEAFDSMTTGTLVSRSVFGGALMGLANLVPGISGGTMLLAAGIYPRFIEAVADTTRFRFKLRSLLVLACVVLSAGLTILLLAGSMKTLVLTQRWMMYSLFIGLTLGGIPIVWRLARPASPTLIFATSVSFLAMACLALLQANGIVSEARPNAIMFFLAGLAGACAMILPGISGGYLLLLMGQYVPILDAIGDFKNALKDRDISAAIDPALSVMVPVGIGVVLGVVLVGNLLQWLLRNQRKATLGLLLGLLIGSTAGLWPFKIGVPPTLGTKVKGEVVTAETLATIDQEDYPTEYFRPTGGQLFGSLTLIGIGYALTMGVARIGGSEEMDA